MIKELECLYLHEKCNDKKDIVIVVHDQLFYIKKCIESLYKTTENFTLYLWDNDSMNPTKEYMESVRDAHSNVVLVRSEDNLGFIQPNNELAKLGDSPYIILLNSDTEVAKNWDIPLMGWLKEHENCKIVGYQGGLLEETGKGLYPPRDVRGERIDYVCGWCLCMERNTYNKYGLFDDKNLSFAYGEDSDLSLRMKEIGYDIYALHLNLVTHFGNKTSIEIEKEKDTRESFENNHLYLRKRWSKYLKTERILNRFAT